VINHQNGTLAVYNYLGALIYEKKPVEDESKVSSFVISNDFLYLGTVKGQVNVFELASGNFIKQIDYPARVLCSKQIHPSEERLVKKIMINSQDNLLIYYQDNSYCLLDQNGKQILAS